MVLKWRQQPASSAAPSSRASNPQQCYGPKEQPLHPKPKPSASSFCLGVWEKQTWCRPSTAITQDVCPRMKICSCRRKELENLCVMLPPTNAHYLWIISLASIHLKNKADLTNTVIFLMTCFLAVWQLHFKKRAHAGSGLIHCGWHRSPLLTAMGAARPAEQLVLEKAEVCS